MMGTAVSPFDGRRNMTPPGRTIDQRRAALEVANEIRIARAKLKHEVTAARVVAGSVILDTPEFAEGMRVFDLLRATYGVGPVKAARMLRAAEISPAKTLGGLTARQRRAIVHLLPRKGQR